MTPQCPQIRGAFEEAFKECGEIKSIRLPSDREAGVLKGFAYIEFDSVEAKVCVCVCVCVRGGCDAGF